MKNVILKTITGIAIMSFFTGGALIGSEEPVRTIAVIMLFLGLGWLFLFSLANSEEE